MEVFVNIVMNQLCLCFIIAIIRIITLLASNSSSVVHPYCGAGLMEIFAQCPILLSDLGYSGGFLPEREYLSRYLFLPSGINCCYLLLLFASLGMDTAKTCSVLLFQSQT